MIIILCASKRSANWGAMWRLARVTGKASKSIVNVAEKQRIPRNSHEHVVRKMANAKLFVPLDAKPKSKIGNTSVNVSHVTMSTDITYESIMTYRGISCISLFNVSSNIDAKTTYFSISLHDLLYLYLSICIYK